MSLLTEQERKQLEDDLEQQIGNHAFAAIEAAILAKLAVAELPATVWVDVPHFTYTADQLRQAHAQGFAAGAASQLAEKPSAWSYKQNRVHSCLQFFCPPDDAYDEGTLIELYTRRQAK